MKNLGTKLVTRWKCDFCNKVYVIHKRGIEHEFKCYKNPDRHCLTCDDTGTETFGYSSDTFDTRDCSSCKIAKIAGGKSYLKVNNLINS